MMKNDSTSQNVAKNMAKKMILVFASSFPTKSNPAVGVYVMNLAAKFRELGYDVKIFVSVPLGKQIYNENDYFEEWRGYLFHFHYLKIFPSRWKILRGLLGSINLYFEKKAALKTLNRLQIQDSRKVVFYGHFVENGMLASKIAERFSSEYAVALGESGVQSFRLKYSEKQLRRLFGEAKQIICVSQKLGVGISEICGKNPDNVSILPNRADEKVFYPLGQESAREKLGIEKEIKIFIFVGQFVERKGYHHLVEILKRRSDLFGVFIGNGESPALTKNILFSGSMKNSEIPLWLAAADVFVLPTRAEGSCNAIAEAIAMGKPLVVSNVPEVREQVNSDSAVIVDPYDESSIERGIDLYFSCKDEYDSNALSAASCETLQRRALNILNTLIQ